MTTDTPPTTGVLVKQVAVTTDEKGFFELQLREPGIVRGCAFWMHQPKVIASAMRGVEPVPMPLLFVECRTDGVMRSRRFAFVPNDQPIAMKYGFRAMWLATALMPNGAGHVFEIVEVIEGGLP